MGQPPDVRDQRSRRESPMFVVFEIPLADARTFVSENTYSLSRTYFKPADELSNPCFTRSFGETHRRRQGGVQNWDNENFFGQSRRGLRFKPWLGDQIFGPDYSINTIDWVSRRLFRNLRIARLEVDFKFSKTPKYGSDLQQTLIELLNLPVHVPHINIEQKSYVPQGETEKPLKAIGSIVALRLLYSTTKHGRKPERWWITAASPFLIVELERRQISSLPLGAKHVYRFSKFDIDLYYFKLQLPTYPNEQYLDVWMLCYGENCSNRESLDILREIRLNTSRFVTERKCLQIFISHLQDNRIRFERQNPSSEELQDYLKESFDLLQNGKGLNLSKRTRSHLLSAMVRQIDDLVHPGDYISLLTNLKDVRRNLLRQIQTVIQEQMSPESVKNYFINLGNQQIGNSGIGFAFEAVKAENISGLQQINLPNPVG